MRKNVKLQEQSNENLEAYAINLYKKTKYSLSEDDLVFGQVSKLGTFVRGKNITAAEMIEGNIPVISAGILPSGTHNTHNVKGPSITVSGSGVNAGYVSFHNSDIWAADCSYNNDSQYIHCLYVILRTIQDSITELQKGTAQPHVYPKELNPFEIDYPKPEILDKLESSYKKVFLLIENNFQEIQLYEKTKSVLLAQLSR